jgi:phosphatidylinositol dimannoside acyltransferase
VVNAFRWLAYPAYRTAERLALALPGVAVPWAAAVGASVAVVLMPRRRRMVARHLRRVRGPELRGRPLARSVWQVFRSYAAYWLDTFRVRKLDAHELDARVRPEGREHLDRALAAGTGVVIATPHLGSWDLAGAWGAAQGYPLVVVMERLQPPRLLDWFCDARRRLGMEVVVRGPDVMDRLESALRRNQAVVLVCDRDLSGRGVEVELFGERTTLPVGPGSLARRCGAALVPVAVYDLEGDRNRAVVRPPVPLVRSGDESHDISVITQRLADELEDLIRAAPEQWHLLQPNWPSDHDAPRRSPARGVGDQSCRSSTPT